MNFTYIADQVMSLANFSRQEPDQLFSSPLFEPLKRQLFCGIPGSRHNFLLVSCFRHGSFQ